MEQFDLGQQLFGCFILGCALAVMLMVVVGIGKVWRYAWAWIDDAEPGRNPILELMAKARGWTQHDAKGTSETYLWWKDKKGERQTEVVLPFFFTALTAPVAVFVGIKLYPILLSAITLAAIAYVARFARRHKKLFDKHLKDHEAHK